MFSDSKLKRRAQKAHGCKKMRTQYPQTDASGRDVHNSDQEKSAPSKSDESKSNNATSEAACCYICLAEGPLGPDQPLMQPCKCTTRLAHALCSARWQLHSAGRFCKSELPDWMWILDEKRNNPPAAASQKLVYRSSAAASTVRPTASAVDPPPALAAYMRISYNGRSHKIKVQPGAEGSRQFVDDCRKLLGICTSVDFDVVFHCKEPFTGGDLSFRSLAAYDAAVACAALAAPASLAPTTATHSATQPSSSPPATPGPPRQAAGSAPPVTIQQPAGADPGPVRDLQQGRREGSRSRSGEPQDQESQGHAAQDDMSHDLAAHDVTAQDLPAHERHSDAVNGPSAHGFATALPGQGSSATDLILGHTGSRVAAAGGIDSAAGSGVSEAVGRAGVAASTAEATAGAVAAAVAAAFEEEPMPSASMLSSTLTPIFQQMVVSCPTPEAGEVCSSSHKSTRSQSSRSKGSILSAARAAMGSMKWAWGGR